MLQRQLQKLHSSLLVFYDTPEKVFEYLLKKYDIQQVFTNKDYEPYANERDKAIAALLTIHDIKFNLYKDQVIFEENEIVKDDNKPYTVFTPYSKKWKLKINDFYLSSYPCEKYFQNLFKLKTTNIPSLEEMGFFRSDIEIPSSEVEIELISHYNKTRNFPGIRGTSRIGIHLRFGTVSIRKLAKLAVSANETYLNELIWRDFYFSILFHFPKVGYHHAFREEYEKIQWRNNETEFKKWCDGNTGYPMVDAGMRELNATGYMHNRVRMVTASFLSKHLLIDWRWGEAYFAEKLLDYDLAANNGGWQWAAGCGCDAAPYFRIFNPYLQAKKFDPELIYIKKWIPELEELTYPLPIVEHEFARKRCLEEFSKALKMDLV